MVRLMSVVFTIGFVTAAWAQTSPTALEIARYDGLFKAAQDGDADQIEKLLAEGANANARDTLGRTPIHVAAFASQDQALIALAEGGADMDALDYQSYDVVTIAAVADDPELMSLAIELGNSPGLTTSPYDGTALIAAVHLGHVDVVRRLIAAGAPLDHVNNLHWTAVIEAVVLGDGGEAHQAVLDALLTAGADRTLADRSGITPLQHAESREYSEMAERLKRQD